MHGIFSEYYFDLVVDMLLFGLLGFMLAVDGCHVAIGLLVAYVMMVVLGMIFLEYLLWMSYCLWIISG